MIAPTRIARIAERAAKAHRAWLVVVAVIGSAASSAGAGGCGGDDVYVTLPDGGSDAAHDATAGDSAGSSFDADTDAGGDAFVCVGNSDAALDGTAVQSGRALVLSLGCAGCHQATPADAGLALSGNGTSIADGGAVYPPNLTPEPATGLGCWTDPQIVTAILDGTDDQGVPLCAMPKYGAEGVDGGAAEDIAQFLRSLVPIVNGVPPTTCPASVDGGGAPDGGIDGGIDAPDAASATPDSGDAASSDDAAAD